MQIFCIGIGPGDEKYMTEMTISALQQADVLVGYSPYFQYITKFIEDKEIISTGMKKERVRAEKAFIEAEKGKLVAVISSGDAGVYGMAPLLWEMKKELKSLVKIEVIPGISAMFTAAAKLGAPLGHDFCSISLSDLLTPWAQIEKRIKAAVNGDFVTAIYNPISKGRFWQLMRLKDLFLKSRSEDTPVGIVRNAGRNDEKIIITNLAKLNSSMADMFSVIIIGNSQAYEFENKIITPRGYYNQHNKNSDNVGRQIMNESFRSILKEIDIKNKPLDHTWIALHCIHTTADINIQSLIETTNNVVQKLYDALYSDSPPVIITDVSMVTQGIRKALIEKLGLQVKCYLTDNRTISMAKNLNITRTQAGIKLAVEDYPNAIFAFGNAPTALIELVHLIRNKKANPIGVIAAPVGFVNVKESKWQLKYACSDVPAVFVHGRKGGSNVAATIINAILSWNEAKTMHPGKGV